MTTVIAFWFSYVCLIQVLWLILFDIIKYGEWECKTLVDIH